MSMRSIILATVILAFGPALAMHSVQADDTSPPSNLRDYFLVLLVRSGPERSTLPNDLARRQRAFMDSNARSGAYKVSGVATDRGRIHSLAIMEAKDIDAARAIVEQDPAVRAEIVTPEIHPMKARDLSALSAAYAKSPHDLRPYFLSLMMNAGQERIPMPDDVFVRHMAYRNARTAEGVYKLGGPVTDGGSIRGATILHAESLEAARAIVERDPAVLAGILRPDVHPVLVRDLSPLEAKPAS